jgi:hypothetical protein
VRKLSDSLCARVTACTRIRDCTTRQLERGRLDAGKSERERILVLAARRCVKPSVNLFWGHSGGGEAAAVVCCNMAPSTKDILRRVESWPEEDQEELVEMARAIEARRTGVYLLTEDERAAIDASRRSAIASDEKVREFWERFGIA